MALFDASSTEEEFDENSNDEDFLLALQLQNRFDQEDKPKQQSKTTDQIYPMDVVDKRWELIDPNPNIYELFQQFNGQFFYGKLDSVFIEWSKRMTRCAGICSYRRGGECRIALSASYLTLRPRKDLVETLLHEMIHAFLFVTHNNRDRDGHGPEFLKHMVRINDATGSNITVYHSFHDEFDHLHGHWWRCTGSCREWKPFHGYVKQSMNRAPSARDRWWGEHERRCGGQFEKVKEPENYKTKESKKRTCDEISAASTSQIAVTTKRKKNATPSEIPKHGTIDTFFKKTKSASSLSTQPELIEIDVIERTWKTTTTTEDIKANYVKCPKCDVALPKANLFIHQIRCTR